jgi:hypothetical protein
MISLALIALAAAAGAADGMAQPRKAYEQCMQKQVDSNLQEKVEPTKFEAAMAAACAAQETALKSAIISHYVAMKTPRKEAEQSAVDWVTDLREGAKERYRGAITAAAKPVT